jgi:hypothetical protein
MSGGMVFVLVIIAIVTIGRIARTAIRARHGLPNMEFGGWRGAEQFSQANAELGRENQLLRSKVERLEDRMAVLERIATDAPSRLTAEIDKLR